MYGGCHPADKGCLAEGRDMCECKYHVVSKKDDTIYSYDSFKDADAMFTELTGEKKLTDLLIKKL